MNLGKIITNIKMEKVFIFVALFFGLLLIIVTPPFQLSDEPGHFVKAYAISEGHIIPDKKFARIGSMLPVSLNFFWTKYYYLFYDVNQRITPDKIFDTYKNIPLNKDVKDFILYSNTGGYSPIPYIPQSIGISLGKMFNSPPFVLLYLGRLFNLLFYIFVGYFAIKMTPVLKLITFLILTYPMNVALAASSSCDAMLISVATLFFAKILQYSYDKNIEILDKKKIIFLFVLAIILANIKYNFLLLFFVLLIPKAKFGKNYFAKILAIILPPLVLAGIWSKLSEGLVYLPYTLADWQEQLDFIWDNPLFYIKTLFYTIYKYLYFYYMTSIGVLGWLNLRLPHLIYIMYMFVILSTFLYDMKNKVEEISISKWKEFLVFVILLLHAFFVFLVLYLTYTEPGNPLIEGVQGRYFAQVLLAFFFLLFVLIPRKEVILKYISDKIPLFVIIWVFFALSLTVLSCSIRFYIF